MASKILAAVFAVAVLSVGGYTYWHYADGTPCGGAPTQAPESSLGCPVASGTLPCCQQPTRAACVTLAPGEGCCDEAPSASPEVLNVAPRELK